MALRFHRSIRIAKGVRLNISKRGVGVSVGPRGAKISSGPRGVYTHMGIPGTGLSLRTKLGSSSQQSSGQSSSTEELTFAIEVSIDGESGTETVLVSHQGEEVTDPSTRRKVLRNPLFRERLQNLREKANAEINAKTQVLVEIHTHATPLPNWDALREEYTTKKPALYSKKVFTQQKPTISEVHSKLEKEALTSVTALFGRKRKRREYIESRLEAYLEDETERWEEAKQSFIEQEADKELRLNAKYQADYAAWKQEVSLTFTPTEPYLTEKFEQLLSEIELPVEFSVSFALLDKGARIYLDIDLPEIEDYPQKKSAILATGKISVKNKSIKQKKLEYLRSIAGMSIYVASLAFSLSPVVEHVVVSGYTQRIQRATGAINDEYVYSVEYDIQGFRALQFATLHPEKTLLSFDHRMKVTAGYDLKTIVPFEV